MKHAFGWLVRWGPAACCMGIIFALSHRTADDLESWLPWFQRVVPGMSGFDWGHFIAYFVLAVTLAWGFGSSHSTWRVRIAIAAICLGYGISDEIHQHFVEGRHPDWKDVRNDMIGATAALLVLAVRPIGRTFGKMADSMKF
ncbi:hypothetical protein DUZ99_04125 [Xylanibacillus composti]|uniref:VanZ-like domain-containing protein n=1 Tax=Xylanibacillus composti TaxID=1572762 RepID=A0A8J4H2C3_9BACL|nr:VanZ family protein [Xylanibacillus composti]MDT9724174.1 hypothetical protein [Xylanibacillus composti]GIQ68311.1 hypothetical protein XYCOK13_11350 [Xylanibacillus composti]